MPWPHTLRDKLAIAVVPADRQAAIEEALVAILETDDPSASIDVVEQFGFLPTPAATLLRARYATHVKTGG